MLNKTNFIEILKIHLIMRIEKDYSNIVKYIPFVKRAKNVIFIKNIFFTLLSTVTAILLYFKFEHFINQWMELIIIIILSIFSLLSIISGTSSYRRTHFPVYQDLLHVSPLNNRMIFLLLMVEEVLWFLVQSSGLIITLFICLCLIIKPPIVLCILLLLNLLVIISLIYMITNRLCGVYQTYKLKNQIGLIRLSVYLVFATVSLIIGFTISISVSKVIIALRNTFESISQLLEDQYWISVKDTIFHDFSYTFIVFNNTVIKNGYYFITSLINIIPLSLIFIIAFACIILLLHYLYPNYSTNRLLRTRKSSMDWLTVYVNMINKLFNSKKEPLFQKELINLKRSRWIVSPGAFSITLYSLEGFFYYGILLAIGTITTDKSLILSMLFLFNVLTIIIHCFEVSHEYPQVFSLGSEGQNIDLLRSSPKGVSQLFDVKLKLLKSILFFPLTINALFSILILIYTNTISFLSLLLLGLLFILLYKTSPLIQLYMSPTYSKFSYDDIQEIGNTYDEQELHVTLQGIPRYFILVPLMIFSYLNLIIPIYKVIPAMHIFYFLGFSIPMIAFWIISKKIILKGINRLEKIK